ncbi:MAG: hypothetical protein HY290_01300 [Planctomycetia bacterium]|nr:hypothetical protein [Planctomycetia bacterium]
MARMAIALAVTGVAFAAFCVWLTVRIVNRRERWAKWMLATVVGVPALYVVSFGPACWWFSIPSASKWPNSMPNAITVAKAPRLCWPLGWVMRHGHPAIRKPVHWYALLNTQTVAVPSGPRDDDWFICSEQFSF